MNFKYLNFSARKSANKLSELQKNINPNSWSSASDLLKEIKPIFTITMLDHFPRMSVFHQERTGFVTIEQEYYAFIQ
jgi:hypothetical protein